jgi:GT2 family glycosyltransferase
VIFLDHDDRWEPDCLEVLLAALEADPTASAAHGLALAVDMDPDTFKVVDPHVKHKFRRIPTASGTRPASQSEPTTFHMLIWDNCITTTGVVLIRRDALIAAGLFDQKIEPLDDWDMYFRLALSAHLVFVDKVVIHWRMHASNTSHNKDLMNEATCAIRQKMLSRKDLDPADVSCIRRRFRRMYRSEFRHDAIDMAAYSCRCIVSGSASKALSYLAGALRKYGAYLWLHVYWNDKYYGRPVPVRFADRMKQPAAQSTES